MALTLLLSKARPPSKSTTTWDAYFADDLLESLPRKD